MSIYTSLNGRVASTLAAGALTLAAGAVHAETIGETGRLEIASTIDDGVVEVVTLRNSYVDPVVVAFVNTRNDDESVIARVSDVSGDSFAIFLEEPDGGSHGAETVSYLVMERGTHFLHDGRRVEAGSIDTDTTHTGGNTIAGDAVSFTAGFDAAPAVLHGLNTNANGDFMASLAANVDAAGFELGLEAAETGIASTTETIAYIAIEVGEGTLADGSSYHVGADSDGSKDGIGQTPHVIGLSGFAASPDVVAAMYGTGKDGGWARGAGVFDATGQSVVAEEDQVGDSERNHVDEVFARVAFPADSDLTAAEGALQWRLRNDGMPSSSQWVIRELALCADSACAEPLHGVAIDDGNSRDWSAPANAFDGDSSTLWKTFDVEDGTAYIGLTLDTPQEVAGVAIEVDNAVYVPDGYLLEYYDDDAAAWITADYIVGDSDDIQVGTGVRTHFPTAWRVQTAVEAGTGANWAVTELEFCGDADCAEPLSGTVIDSGDAYDWAPADNAFDDDTSTYYKATHASAGLYLGLEFQQTTDVEGLYVRTSNVVYTADALRVQYYDAVQKAWVDADYLMGFEGGADHQFDVEVRDRFPVSWRLVTLGETSSGYWAVRELAFCVDTACAAGLDGGEAFDDGNSYDWAPVTHAFDGDTDTFVKTRSGEAGQAIGLDFDAVSDAVAVYLRTDNAVYTADEVDVQYYDILSGAWTSAGTFTGFAGSADHVLLLD